MKDATTVESTLRHALGHDGADKVKYISFAIDGGVAMADLLKTDVDGEVGYKFPDKPNDEWRFALLAVVDGKNDMLLVSHDGSLWSIAIAVVIKGELCFRDDLSEKEVR